MALHLGQAGHNGAVFATRYYISLYEVDLSNNKEPPNLAIGKGRFTQHKVRASMNNKSQAFLLIEYTLHG